MDPSYQFAYDPDFLVQFNWDPDWDTVFAAPVADGPAVDDALAAPNDDARAFLVAPNADAPGVDDAHAFFAAPVADAPAVPAAPVADAPAVLAAAADAAGAVRRLWIREETEFLLDQASQTIKLVDSLDKAYVPNSYMWTEISRKMQAHGYGRTKDECRFKYRKLLSSYKKRRGKAPTNPKWSYFDHILEVHVRREEAKAAAEEAKASSSSAAPRVRARVVERRRRRAPSGQGGAWGVPTGQAGAGGVPSGQGVAEELINLLTPELDKRDAKIFDYIDRLFNAGSGSGSGSSFSPPLSFK